MRKRELRDKAAVQAAVRQVADEYLTDPNITSVGVGYELKERERTGRLTLQFTVEEKLQLERLESAGKRRIPETITVNDIVFVTDVVERSFEKHPVAAPIGRARPVPDRSRSSANVRTKSFVTPLSTSSQVRTPAFA